MPRQFWLLKRMWSEKAHHHRGYQPYIWKPIKEFPINALPTSRIGLDSFIKRIARQYGAGHYRVLREQFENEKPHFRPIIQFQVRPDYKWRITKRHTQHKANKNEPDSYFKQHQRRLLVTTDAHDLLRDRQRNMIKALQTRVPKPKPYVHTIRSSTSNRPWKVTVTH